MVNKSPGEEVACFWPKANVYLVPFWRALVLAATSGKLAVGFKRPATPPVTSLREVLLW